MLLIKLLKKNDLRVAVYVEEGDRTRMKERLIKKISNTHKFPSEKFIKKLLF